MHKLDAVSDTVTDPKVGTPTLSALGKCCFFVPGEVRKGTGLSSISVVHRWLGQAAMLGLVP